MEVTCKLLSLNDEKTRNLCDLKQYLAVRERSLHSEHSRRVDTSLDPLLQGLVSVLRAPSVGSTDPEHLNTEKFVIMAVAGCVYKSGLLPFDSHSTDIERNAMPHCHTGSIKKKVAKVF